MENSMSANEVQHPGRVGLKVENDYLNNGHNDSNDQNFRWNGPELLTMESHSAKAARMRAENDERLKK
jgi:hypothetical protein